MTTLVNHPLYLEAFVKECTAHGLPLTKTAELFRSHWLHTQLEKDATFRRSFDSTISKHAGFLRKIIPAVGRVLAKNPIRSTAAIGGAGIGAGALGKSILSPEQPDIGKVGLTPSIAGHVMSGGRGGNVGWSASSEPSTGVFGIPLGQRSTPRGGTASTPYFSQLQDFSSRANHIDARLAEMEARGRSLPPGLGGALEQQSLSQERARLMQEKNELLNSSNSFLTGARSQRRGTLRSIAQQQSLLQAKQLSEQPTIDSLTRRLQAENAPGVLGAGSQFWNRITGANQKAQRAWGEQQNRLTQEDQLKRMQQGAETLLPPEFQ